MQSRRSRRRSVRNEFGLARYLIKGVRAPVCNCRIDPFAAQ